MSLSDITNCHCPTCSDNLTKFKRDIPIKSEYDREKQRSHEMNKYVISVSILLLSSSTSLAQDSCMVRPSCADMGYTKSASDCIGKKAIACPFDLSAYYCPEVGESCDFSEFPLTECPANGNCTDFECEGTTQYKLDSCNSCYVISENNCIYNDCCDYNYTVENLDEGFEKCENIVVQYGQLDSCADLQCSSDTLKQDFYKVFPIITCDYGKAIKAYDFEGDTYICEQCDFSSYPLASCPSNGNCSNYSCGGNTKYKLDSCNSGYNKKGNTCEYDSCYYAEDLDCLNGCADYDYECGVCLECDCSACIDDSNCNRPQGFDEGCDDCPTECADDYCKDICYQGSCNYGAILHGYCGCYEYCCDDISYEYNCTDWCENGYQEWWHRDCYLSTGFYPSSCFCTN